MSPASSGFALVTLVWAALAVPVGIYGLLGTDHVGRTGGNPRGPRIAARWGWFGMGRLAEYPPGWFGDPRFLAGAAALLAGAALNVTSDYRVARLRARQRGRYVLPRGGAFRFLSAPNLAGEIVEWIGFALMSWSLPALAFAMWTAANLIPRALWRHRWYRETFPDYPRSRRAIIPGVL